MKSRFWIDVLATIPIDTFAGFFLTNNSSSSTLFLQLFGILKLIRVLRLGRIISYMRVVSSVKTTLRLGKLVFFLVLYIHCLGCAWFMIANVDQKWIPPLDYVFVKTELYEDTKFY